ncbi:hypothetical protein GCM10009836_71110 [Pseudonocardia ailaonensis]|uniref:Uncharacterized protein n=1 Tax=Pseudonocardia ailaonensis TaxID=367279 RepID=A0ABN2NS78_9PSEU
MLVRTDDEVYRVDSVWLGPPRATFPWRARYVSYGLGLLVMVVIMFLQRRIGIGLDFFSVAWSLVLTVVLTRFLGKRIDYERPLGQVAALFRHEVTGPRRRRAPAGGPVRFAHVRSRRGLPGRRGASGPPTRPEPQQRVPVVTTVPAQGPVVRADVQDRERAAGPRATPRRIPARETAPHRAPSRQDPSRQDPGRQGMGRQGMGRQESGRQDWGRQDTGRQDTGRQDTGRQETGRRQPPPVRTPVRRRDQGPAPQPWKTSAERRATGKDRRDGVA